MSELVLAQIAVNDGTDRKIFRQLGPDDPTSPNCYGFFGGYLDRHILLNGYENPIDGTVRLLGEQTHLDMSHGEDLLLGPYSQHIVPPEYSLLDAAVKVHFFEAFIRKSVSAEAFVWEGVNYELAFEGVDYTVLTNKELLKRRDVAPIVRFILEEISVDRHSQLMNSNNI
jgi:hypothetical protein